MFIALRGHHDNCQTEAHSREAGRPLVFQGAPFQLSVSLNRARDLEQARHGTETAGALPAVSLKPQTARAIFCDTCVHSGNHSRWAMSRSSTSDQIWSRSSSAAVCGSIIAAW
jgi:hypothetical protein